MMYRDFWEAGYRVFPLFGADKNGKCECGDPECEAVFKHPRISQWSIIPLFDEDVIDSYEEFNQFSTGYGVLCAGMLVIDVDARNGGIESFDRLLKEYPSINESRLEVATGSGGGSKHIYFSLPESVALIQSHKEYPGIDFKSSGYVVGPGSRHASGGTYEADGYPSEISEAPTDLVDFLRKPERHRAEYNGAPLDVSHQEIADMLSYIPANQPYETWLRFSMAIHHATEGTGFDVWDQWSATDSEGYQPNKMESKWHSFGRDANPVTIGTIIHHAQQHGWIMPISMMDGMGDLPEISMKEPEPANGLPFDISGIDLTHPPGFVGDVANWIEGQSRRPRKHLAVAAALTAIGNIAGLRYTDDKDGVTTNLFTFCVAGSRTGKESILQAVIALHRAAGILPASHGAIKSEQEIAKNLTRHQAAFYVLDEIGIFLQKIKSAQQRGGAIYLEGVIGMLMSAYSKAHGYMLLTGDAKEEVRNFLLKDLATVTKKLNEGGPSWLEQRVENLNFALANIDKGLDRPFLSLIGFTTPVTFTDLVDREAATNGFIGRSLLFIEHETAPRTKKNFAKLAMDNSIESTAQVLYTAGDYDPNKQRVENYGARVVIPTDAKASDMLDAVLDWIETRAEDQRGEKGLEALWLGAYELVSKVSLILATPGGLRTPEHVRWAFAIVKRDVEMKLRTVVGNDEAKSAPSDALQARITNLCAEPVTLGIIVNRVGKAFRKSDIENMLAKMVEGKLLVEARSTHPRQKTEILKYHVAG